MHTSTLLEGIRNRVAILVDVEPSLLHDDTPFTEFGVDSLMLLELVAMVEQHLGFELPEEDLSKLRTLSDVQRYVLTTSEHG